MAGLSNICKKCLPRIVECAHGIVGMISTVLPYAFFGYWFDLILGFTLHFSSDWVKEHNISIGGGPPQTMRLYEVCENLARNGTVTIGCPPIDYEYAFLVMVFASFNIIFLLRSIDLWMEQFTDEPILLLPRGVLATNIGVAITAILFIISGRQSGQIMEKEVVILDGPYNLKATMKIIAGGVIIMMSFLRILIIGSLLRSGEMSKAINKFLPMPYENERSAVIDCILSTLLVTIFGCWTDIIMGFSFHFTSYWIKEHNISIAGGPPQRMKLFEVCDHWPPRTNHTNLEDISCPHIDTEYAFIGMLVVSFVMPWLLFFIDGKIVKLINQETEIYLAPIGVIIINICLAISACLFIRSGRQSGKIIGKHVHVLDGPYHLHNFLKFIAGVWVIYMSFVRTLFLVSLLRAGEMPRSLEICDCVNPNINAEDQDESEEAAAAAPPPESLISGLGPGDEPGTVNTQNRTFIPRRVRIHPEGSDGNNNVDSSDVARSPDYLP